MRTLVVMLVLTSVAWGQTPVKPKRTFDAKFVAVSLVPHALNLAYYRQYSGCYPATCIDHAGRPGRLYIGFTAVNAGLNVIGYLFKRGHSKAWVPVTLGLTPLHVYDLSTHK